MAPADLAARPAAAGLDATVAAAQADMERLIQLGGLQNDPIRHPIRALSVHLDALVTLTRTMERIISEQKPPISVEDIKALNKAAAANAANEVVYAVRHLALRTFWRTALQAGAALVVALCVGIGAGWWLHAHTGQPPIRDVTSCVPSPQAGGGEAYTCVFWAKPPTTGTH